MGRYQWIGTHKECVSHLAKGGYQTVLRVGREIYLLYERLETIRDSSNRGLHRVSQLTPSC